MNTIDEQAFRLINSWAGRWRLLDGVGILLAEYLPFLLAFFLLVKWFQKREEQAYRCTLLIAGMTFITAEGLAKLLGRLHYHTQPFANLADAQQLIAKEVNNSFPSDHTILFFSFLFLLFVHTKSQGRYAYLLLAVLGGLARIFVGVHYPSDVLAGALLASGVGILFYYGLRRSLWLGKMVAALTQIENNIWQRD